MSTFKRLNLVICTNELISTEKNSKIKKFKFFVIFEITFILFE